MNKASVLKFEYRLLSVAEFAELYFTGFTGTIQKETGQTDAGTVHNTVINLKVPEVSSEKTTLFDSLLFQKAQFRVTDGNGCIHLVGDVQYPARMQYRQAVEAHPGSWNGYEITINHKSPYSYALE